MNIQQVTKIKSLIANSTILNQYERVEWLALLELMNDKQLGELEKILDSKQQTAVSSQQVGQAEGENKTEKSIIHYPLSLTQKSVTTSSQQPLLRQGYGGQAANSSPSFAKATADRQQSAGTHVPPLSHILNLPNNWEKSTMGKKSDAGLGTLASLDKPLLKPAAVLSDAEKKPYVKPTSKFAQRLKAIFKEKELPAGWPSGELELADGKQQSAVSSQQSAILTRPPVIPKPKIIPPVAPPLEQQKSSPTIFKSEPVSKFKPGVVFEKTPDKIKNDTLADIKQHLESKEAKVPAATVKPVWVEEPTLSSLADLAKFDIKMLDKNSLDELVNKIKMLRSQFGYFDVIFSLEKSFVYEAYVATGQQLLAQQASFEKLSANSTSGRYLKKAQFEKFADLLVKIQAA